MSNKVKRDANEDGLVYKTLESIIKKATIPVDPAAVQPVEQAVNPLQQFVGKKVKVPGTDYIFSVTQVAPSGDSLFTDKGYVLKRDQTNGRLRIVNGPSNEPYVDLV
jgi:hypothetical protein